MSFDHTLLLAFISGVFANVWFSKALAIIAISAFLRGCSRARSYVRHRAASNANLYANMLDMQGNLTYLRMIGVGLLSCITVMAVVYAVLVLFYVARFVIVG